MENNEIEASIIGYIQEYVHEKLENKISNTLIKRKPNLDELDVENFVNCYVIQEYIQEEINKLLDEDSSSNEIIISAVEQLKQKIQHYSMEFVEEINFSELPTLEEDSYDEAIQAIENWLI